MDDITQCMVKRINSVIGLLFAFRDLWKECSENTTRGGDMYQDINATMRLTYPLHPNVGHKATMSLLHR